MYRRLHIIGSSGGACVGGLLLLPEVPIDDMVEYICNCAEDARKSLANRFKIRQYGAPYVQVRGAVEKFCPDDVAARLSARLEVSVTKVFGFCNMRWTTFESKGDFVDAILASSCVVGLAGLPYRTRHGLMIDGGFSDLQLLKAVLLGTKFCAFHDETVTSVCPFYCSRADIKPSCYVPLHWALSPPPPDKLRAVYKLGIRDTLHHLQRKHPDVFSGPPPAVLLRTLEDLDTQPSNTSGAASLAHTSAAPHADMADRNGELHVACDAASARSLARPAACTGCDDTPGSRGLTAETCRRISELCSRERWLGSTGRETSSSDPPCGHSSENDARKRCGLLATVESGSAMRQALIRGSMGCEGAADAEEWLAMLEVREGRTSDAVHSTTVPVPGRCLTRTIDVLECHHSLHEAVQFFEAADACEGGMAEVRGNARRSIEDTEAMAHGFRACLRSGLSALSWLLVYVELLLQSQLCAAVLWLSPLLDASHKRRNWARALFCWSGVLNIKLLLKAVPLVGSSVSMHGNSTFERELEQMSLMYRLLFYLL